MSKMKLSDFATNYKPDWCPGCGNYGLWQALKQALVELDADPGETVLVAGIGCHGHINNFTKVSSFEGLHGRPIPVAVGVKLANRKLNVIVSTGDGDCLGEGGNHFIHACRRNHDLTVILHNNSSYSLTTGQASPTSPQGYKSKSTPFGKLQKPFNPLALALVSGAGFVSRGFTGDPIHLTEIFKKAISHKGFSVVDVLQPCVVFNKQFTFAYFREKIEKIGKICQSREEALKMVLAIEEKISTGVFYQGEEASYEEKVVGIKEKSLVDQPLIGYNWEELVREFY